MNRGIVVASALLVAAPLGAQNYEVRLKRAWVVAFADRTSMDASMDVRWAHSSPNPVAEDGDMHFAGVSADVGFPFVAEVVNARLTGQQTAVTTIKQHASNGGTTSKPVLTIHGAWRLWFEHPSERQTQGSKSDPFYPDHTNPNHSFEIHPVSQVGPHDLGGSFIPVAGYDAQTADVAFPYYDAKRVSIKASKSGISIRSKKVFYNYVVFRIELVTAPIPVSDGFVVNARVLNANDAEVATGVRRMIFVGGTRAANDIQSRAAGARLRVLGIPRISLNKVLTLVQNNGTKRFEAVLPYEMIIVGVF